MKTNKFKIADYAKIAAVLLFAQTKTNAEVIYTDLDPDIELLLNGETALIDLDSDGNVDFLFFRTSLTYYFWNGFSSTFRLRQADWVSPYDSVNGILGNPITSSSGGINNIPAAMDTGGLVSSEKYFQPSLFQVMSFGFYKAEGDWHYAFGGLVPWNTDTLENKYLGVKFIDSAACFHYGWIRCEIEDSCKRLIIKDYAYETVCDYPIETGSKESYVSIQVNENTLDANIYSFDNSVFVNLNAAFNNAIMHVYDLKGSEIYSMELQNQFTEINLDTQKGIYLVEIQADEGSIAKKIYLN